MKSTMDKFGDALKNAVKKSVSGPFAGNNKSGHYGASTDVDDDDFTASSVPEPSARRHNEFKNIALKQ